MTFQIVVADDHKMIRRGLRRIIEEDGQGMEVVGEASDGMELMEFLQGMQPDLILLDISMPKLQGIEAARRIKSLYPGVKILILTMHNNRGYLYKAMSAGVDGYILKEETDTELFSAIEQVRQGMVYISPLLQE